MSDMFLVSVQMTLGHEIGAGAMCLKCKDKCEGFELHFWRYSPTIHFVIVNLLTSCAGMVLMFVFKFSFIKHFSSEIFLSLDIHFLVPGPFFYFK